MQKKSFSIQDSDGKILLSQVTLADNFISRFKGLMLTKTLEKNHGLLISPCQQVHTHFMRYAIDLVFLNKEFQVLSVVESMPPWKISRHLKDSHYVLEAPANSIARSIKKDDSLVLASR